MKHSYLFFPFLFLTSLLCAQPPAGEVTPWVFDEIQLQSGAKFRGRILKEASEGLDFQVVFQKPGRPTMTLTTSFASREIASVKRLTDLERTALAAKLAELDTTGDGERRRMESLELAPADWLGKPFAARQYRSERFTLRSGTSEELTRRAAVRLEQIYAAFSRYFPMQTQAEKPTEILLAGRMEEYRELLGPLAKAVLNPAIYDPNTHRITCGTDLQKLDDELQLARKKHLLERGKLDKYEAEIKLLYRGSKPELERYLASVQRERDRLREADRLNGLVFDKSTKQLFALLYHEAFHSYISAHVYPYLSPADVKAGRGPGELPRWLNEGLAQIFETAVIEAGELRVGHADTERLEKFQTLLKTQSAMPLSELLRSGREVFLAGHSGQKGDANRAYLTSWALTYYLTFPRRAIGTKEFTAYLTAINSGAEPLPAFATWLGQDVEAIERDMHDYFRRLRPDGTLNPVR
jgi:hypothetical protein